MPQTCSRPFDEKHLSGYLDGVLTQAAAQRVRLHVEDCAECRKLFEELRTLRDTAVSTRFQAPEEDSWPELPKTIPSRFSRSLGWMVLGVWFALVSSLALWRFLSNTADPLEIFIVLGLPGAFVLLFVSVLLDRLRDYRDDRYRGVHR